MHVELKCIPFVESLPPLGMEQLDATDVMSKAVVTFNEIEPAREVWHKLGSCKHNGFPIVTQDGGKCVGMILRNQLLVMIGKAAWSTADGQLTEAAAKTPLLYDDFACSLQSRTTELDMQALGVTDVSTALAMVVLTEAFCVINPHAWVALTSRLKLKRVLRSIFLP